MAKDLAEKNQIDISKEVSIDPTVLGIKVAALEKAVGQLVEVQRVNHRELLRAFNMVDAHIWVLNRICQDLADGSVFQRPGIAGKIDQDYYFALFNRHQEEQAAAGKTNAQTAEAEDQDVFGGDLSDEDPERNEEAERGQSAGEVSDDAGDAADPMPALSEAGVTTAGG